MRTYTETHVLIFFVGKKIKYNLLTPGNSFALLLIELLDKMNLGINFELLLAI